MLLTNKLVEEYSRKLMLLYLWKKFEQLTRKETTSKVPALQLPENMAQGNDQSVNENDDDLSMPDSYQQHFDK